MYYTNISMCSYQPMYVDTVYMTYWYTPVSVGWKLKILDVEKIGTCG